MRSFLLLLFLAPPPALAHLQCHEILSDSPSEDLSTLLPQSFGIQKSVEDLILSGPFQDAALELTELFLQINDPHFIVKLSHAFQQAEYESSPEINPETNWFVWKAQFSLTHPHLYLSEVDWVRLWNIYAVLQEQFSQNWSPSQIAWISSWLLKIVSQEHFLKSTSTINLRAETNSANNGPLRMLQDPLLHKIYETLLSDSVFKTLILKIIKESNKYNPRLKDHLLKPKVVLTINLDSQILVNLAFQVLFARLQESLDKQNWKARSSDGVFIPDDIHLYLADLFAIPRNLELAIDLLKNIFLNTPIPIIENEFQTMLLASLRQQMRPIIDEALNRATAPAPAPLAAPVISISRTPLPLADHMDNILEPQSYSFTMVRSAQLGIQTLVFAPESLDLYKTEKIDSISKFMQALQYGFTDADGSNGLKKLLVENYYELKPGVSSYRMIVLRSGKTWTILATMHKDKVPIYMAQVARSTPRPRR